MKVIHKSNFYGNFQKNGAINFQVIIYSLAKCRKLLLGNRSDVIIYICDTTTQRKRPKISRL